MCCFAWLAFTEMPAQMLHFTSSSVTIYVKWTTPLNNYAQLTIKNYSSWYQKVYTLYIVLKIALVQLLNNRGECRIFTLFMDNTTYAENFLVKVGTLKSLENQRP